MIGPIGETKVLRGDRWAADPVLQPRDGPIVIFRDLGLEWNEVRLGGQHWI